MPPQDAIAAVHASGANLSDALADLALQPLALDKSSHPGKTDAKAALALTATCSLPEPPAPITCLTPRLHSSCTKPGSHAAINVQCNKSPFAQRTMKKSAGAAVLRKSADAVLVTARSASSSSPRAAAFRQARQRTSLQKSTGSGEIGTSDIAAAVRRSRVLPRTYACLSHPVCVSYAAATFLLHCQQCFHHTWLWDCR